MTYEELDLEIADKIMGWENYGDLGWSPRHGLEPSRDYLEKYGDTQFSIPKYSTNILNALEVTKELPLDSIKIYYNHPFVDPVTVVLRHEGKNYYGHGQTEAHAICLAALEFNKCYP